jgi:hypothetical protein
MEVNAMVFVLYRCTLTGRPSNIWSHALFISTNSQMRKGTHTHPQLTNPHTNSLYMDTADPTHNTWPTFEWEKWSVYSTGGPGRSGRRLKCREQQPLNVWDAAQNVWNAAAPVRVRCSTKCVKCSSPYSCEKQHETREMQQPLFVWDTARNV